MLIFGSKKLEKEVENACDKVLCAIEINGYYMLPTNFETETYESTLHLAIRKLISEGAIEKKGWEGAYTRWGRATNGSSK